MLFYLLPCALTGTLEHTALLMASWETIFVNPTIIPKEIIFVTNFVPNFS